MNPANMVLPLLIHINALQGGAPIYFGKEHRVAHAVGML